MSDQVFYAQLFPPGKHSARVEGKQFDLNISRAECDLLDQQIRGFKIAGEEPFIDWFHTGHTPAFSVLWASWRGNDPACGGVWLICNQPREDFLRFPLPLKLSAEFKASAAGFFGFASPRLGAVTTTPAFRSNCTIIKRGLTAYEPESRPSLTSYQPVSTVAAYIENVRQEFAPLRALSPRFGELAALRWPAMAILR